MKSAIYHYFCYRNCVASKWHISNHNKTKAISSAAAVGWSTQKKVKAIPFDEQF